MLLIEINLYVDEKQLIHWSENYFILFCVFEILTIIYICYPGNRIWEFAFKIRDVFPSNVGDWGSPTKQVRPLLTQIQNTAAPAFLYPHVSILAVVYSAHAKAQEL